MRWFRKEQQVSDEATQPDVDRAQLIDRAQQLGIDRPWFKSNDDLTTAIAEEEHRQAGLPTTRTTVDEPDVADVDSAFPDVAARNAAAKEGAPSEGADHPDPYAHLGGSGVVTEEAATTTDDDETEA
jgi:hypothetical protein